MRALPLRLPPGPPLPLPGRRAPPDAPPGEGEEDPLSPRTTLRAPALALLLLAAPAFAAAEGDAAPVPAPRPAPPPGEKPPAAETAPPGDAPAWEKDLDAARRAAKERGRRILAVVTAGSYASEPSDRLAKALEEPEARKALAGFVPLRVAEGADPVFSKGLGLEDLGLPYTALLDAGGKPLAWLRGAWGAAEWSKEVLRLAAGADVLEAKEAAAREAPKDARALWEASEALRGVGRVREADEALGGAEAADPGNGTGLLPLFRYRRLEARVEDRMAVQDFEGARVLLDAYDREFPDSPRRPWVALLRAVARAYRGEAEAALEDLREVAVAAKDGDLEALAKSRIAALEKVLEARKK